MWWAVGSKDCFLMSLLFLMKKGSSSHREGVGVAIGALCVMKLEGDDDDVRYIVKWIRCHKSREKRAGKTYLSFAAGGVNGPWG